MRRKLREVQADGTVRMMDVFDSDDSQDEIKAILRLRIIRKVCLSVAVLVYYVVVLVSQPDESCALGVSGKHSMSTPW